MKILTVLKLAGSMALVIATQAGAITIVDIGTVAPPTTLGGFALLPFDDDVRPTFDYVTEVAPPAGSPVSGNLGFDANLAHYKVGDGWSTWSHGYAGDVYHFEDGDFGPLTLTLPTGTKAFYLYTQPNFYDNFLFSISSGSEWVAAVINGYEGAHGVGFYATGAESLVSVTVENISDFSDGFAVGEFGINGTTPVPDGAVHPLAFSALLLGLAALALRFRSRKPDSV